MSRFSRLLIAISLLLAMFGAACSSSAEITTSGQGSQAQAAEPQAEPNLSSPSAAAPVMSLATTPLDYAVISAGQVSTPTTPIPCHLSGPVATGFAESRGMSLRQVSGNNCQWSEGLFNTLDIHFREIADIDVAQRRQNHGANDTLVPQDGPGTDAATYLQDDGLTTRYFFIAGSRAVFLVAESQTPTTETELRAMADEIAGLIGSAVDQGQFWSDAGERGEDPLCTVWSAETLRQMFGAVRATPSSSGGCEWALEGTNNDGHKIELSIDQFNSTEIYTREGGSNVAIGDRAVALTLPGIYGTIRQVAFVVGDRAMTVIVDSPNHSDLADVLAANVADRLG